MSNASDFKQPPFTIHAPIGSKAEEQARKRNLPFVAE